MDDGASGLRESPVSSAVALAAGLRSLTGAILPGLRPFTWHGGTSAVGCCPWNSMSVCQLDGCSTVWVDTTQTSAIGRHVWFINMLGACRRAHLAVLVLGGQLVPYAAVDAAASLLLRQTTVLVLQQPPAMCAWPVSAGVLCRPFAGLRHFARAHSALAAGLKKGGASVGEGTSVSPGVAGAGVSCRFQSGDVCGVMRRTM